jgi:hypothetical protein
MEPVGGLISSDATCIHGTNGFALGVLTALMVAVDSKSSSKVIPSVWDISLLAAFAALFWARVGLRFLTCEVQLQTRNQTKAMLGSARLSLLCSLPMLCVSTHPGSSSAILTKKEILLVCIADVACDPF